MKEKIVKKAIMLLVALALLISAASAATVVSIQDASAKTGETVTIPIKIENVNNLGGADIWLSYDKNVVIVESIANGDLGSLAASNIDNVNGVTKMNWFSANGKTGSFVFAYITLKAVGNGGDTSVLDITVKELVDADGFAIAHTVTDGKFTVTPVAPVPVLTSIAVSPPAATLIVGGTQVFSATANDQNSNPMAGVTISWTSSNPSVGTVNPASAVTNAQGIATTTFTALTAGTTTVKAASGEISGSALVTVTGGQVQTTVSIPDASAKTGETVTVPIKIENVNNLGGADIWLSYDKNVVTVESIADGDIGALAASNIDNVNGVTKMNWFSAAGKTGSFVFAYVTLKAVGNAGQTSLLDLTVKELVDADGNPIAQMVKDGKFTIPGAAGPAVSVVPPKTLVSPGGSFTIDIVVDPAGSEVFSGQFNLFFNTTILNATGITQGSFLSQDGASTIVIAKSIDNAAGKIEYGETRLGVLSGVKNKGVIAKISFVVKPAAKLGDTSKLDLEGVILSDPAADLIPDVIVNDGIAEVGGLPPVAIAETNHTKNNVDSKAYLNGTKSYDPDGTIVSYEWDFGDGTTGAGSVVSHVYKVKNYAGYNATLVVKDNMGLTNSTVIKLPVWIPGDANNDKTVNILDATKVGIAWGKKYGEANYDDGADLNNDNIVNILDATIIGINWGKIA